MAQVLTSVHNPIIKAAKALWRRARRDEQGCFLAEGVRVLEEAVAAGADIETIFYSSEARMKERIDLLLSKLERSAQMYEVTPTVLGALSSTQTPQGIVAIVRRHDAGWDQLVNRQSLVLLADQVGDPGNLGTMVRTVAAVGASGLVSTRGAVDLYNPKTVRASAGALFRIASRQDEDPAFVLDWIRSQQLTLVVAEASGSKLYYDLDWTRPIALAIGSEAFGFSPGFVEAADFTIRLPMPGGTESLNAAITAAVCLYEAARQRNLGEKSQGGELESGL